MSEQITATDRLIRFCQEEHNELLNGLDNKTAWSKEADLGYGNQVVSEAHDERTVLELIQNARDAIIEGDDEGRVSVIVGPDSLMVANTGSPFRLDQEEVFRAVTSLGRSAKAQDRGSIGEKGVGLKSILQLSEQFSIHSEVKSEHLSAHFSRARTARMLLATYADLLTEESFRRRFETLGDSALVDVCQSVASEFDGKVAPDYLDIDSLRSRLLDADEDPPDPEDILSDLPRLSLFRYPFPDSSLNDSSLRSHLVGKDTGDRSATDSLDSELRAWLNEQDGSFTTVVELDYVDTEWQTLLGRIDDELAAISDDVRSTFRSNLSSTANDGEPASRQEKLWQECTEISPETLILLGHIEQLDLVRVTQDEDGSLRMDNHRQIRVDHGDATHLATESPISRQPVTYTVTDAQDGENGTYTRTFRQYSRSITDLTDGDEQRADKLHVLFEKPVARDGWKPTVKPLYLYYPIEEVETPFPFVIHAPFRVGFDRQSLADDEQNQRILEMLPAFVAKVATDLAAGESAPDPADTESFGSWMPWLVTPLTSTDVAESEDVAGTVERTLDRLSQEAIVPTDAGEPCPPVEVLCDPERLHAFEPLRSDAPDTPLPGRSVVESGSLWRDASFETDDSVGSKFRDCAGRIGLTAVLDRPFDDGSHRGCIDILCEFWGIDTHSEDAIQWAVSVNDVTHASEYFESVCSVLRAASDGDELDVESDSIAKQAAKKLGKARVPLLPAEAHRAYDDEGTPAITHLVRARSRHDGNEGRGASRSERIVFRRTGGDQSDRSIISDLPTPPSGLPVFVVPFRADWTGPLEGFNRDWGTRKLDSPAEFYRRVAAEAGGYSGDATGDPEIVGYLNELYETVTRGQIAEWLRPIPHRHHQFGELQETLKGGKTYRTPSDYDDYLERRYVQRVRLPVADSAVTSDQWVENSAPHNSATEPAEELAFGSEWADEFEAAANTLETYGAEADRFDRSDTDQDTRETAFRRWAAAIRLASDSAARSLDELAPPDDDYWTTVFGDTVDSNGFDRIQRLDLLIHLGVQVGPRIDWRWTLPKRGERDRAAATITVSEAQTLAEGDVPNESDFRPPERLVEAYRDVIWRSDNNPAFSASHSTGCGNNWLETDVTDRIDDHPGGALLPMWWYFPDLPAADSVAGRRYRDAVLLMWPELSDGVSEVAWLCCNWHSFSTASEDRWIPSLGLVQLSHSRFWPAEPMFEDESGNDRLTITDGEYFQATRLLFHDDDHVRGAVQYLPRIDIETLEDSLSDALDADVLKKNVVDLRSALRSLGIQPLSGLTPPMAAERLNWFVSQFDRGADVSDGAATQTDCREFPIASSWSIQALSVPKDALMRRLVADEALARRLDDREPKRRWIRRDLHHIGTCIPITEGNESKALRIGKEWPANDDSDVVVFTRPLSKYSRDRLVSDGRPFVERPADETELAYALGDADDTADFGIVTETEPPSPRPVHGVDVEIGSDRLKQLQSRLKSRQEYLLASYLEHATAPDLQSVHDDISAVLENQIGVVERDNDDDARRNSAEWQPPERSSSPHIALFRDSIERYQDEEIPPYLAADGLVQVIEQFDLRDTFENVLFKSETALENEYSDALENVRREVTELRTLRLEEVYRTLDALASTRCATVSLPAPDAFDVDPRPTLTTARAAIDDRDALEDNRLLKAWSDRLENECGLDSDSVARCLVAAATDDHETRHRLAYRLAREGVLDIETLVELGHHWEQLDAWPHSPTTRPIESYVIAADRVRRFWDTLTEYEDEGEDGIERAALNIRTTTNLPSPRRRVTSLIRDNSVLDAEFQRIRLGEIPYVTSEPPALDRLAQGISEWVAQERTELQNSDVVYNDPLIDDFLEQLVTAISDPNDANERLESALETFSPKERNSSSDSTISRTDLTADWIRNDDEVERIASEFTSATELTDGGSPDIGESSGGGYTHVNAAIDARGREGELICLNRAWNSFRDAPPDTRKEILDTVEQWRAHTPWRLKSVSNVSTSLSDPVVHETHHSEDLRELLEIDPLENTPEAKAAFHALFDTSSERGPGFDLIDPFAVMPSDADPATWDSTWMRRVEAKAVDSGRIHNGRIKLTGNELRMALRPGPIHRDNAVTDKTDNCRYLVRLVGFPTDWRENENPEPDVQLLDIENVADFVGIDDSSTTILEKLRGGSFYITFQT